MVVLKRIARGRRFLDRVTTDRQQKVIVVAEESKQLDWQRAASFAARLHEGQYRKDGRTPYAAHVFRVSLTVRHLFGVDDSVAIAAALLHDLIEDTTADYDDILEQFGSEVADAVAALTKDMRLPEQERELAYDRQLAQAAWQARLVKLADVYDNLSDLADAKKLPKTIEKARRAVKLAGDDLRLSQAVSVVNALIENLAP